MEHYGSKIIKMIEKDKSFNKFNTGEVVALMSVAAYILGRQTGETNAGIYEQIEDDIDKAG
jgi:hypothetical protein